MDVLERDYTVYLHKNLDVYLGTWVPCLTRRIRGVHSSPPQEGNVYEHPSDHRHLDLGARHVRSAHPTNQALQGFGYPSKVHNHNMLGLAQPTVYEASKCFFSYGRLSHLDPQQLPTAWDAKGKPWSSVLVDGFVRRVGVSPPSSRAL